VQGLPSGSDVHVGEQQFPGELVARHRTAHRRRARVAADVDLLAGDDERGVCTPPAGRSGPSTLKELVPQGLPVNGVGRDRIADESAGAAGSVRIPREEAGADPAARRQRAGEAGARMPIEGRVDGAQVLATSVSTP